MTPKADSPGECALALHLRAHKIDFDRRRQEDHGGVMTKVKGKYRWNLMENGYDIEWKYVLIEKGLYCGVVSGSDYRPRAGWYAGVLLPGERKHLGEYTTLNAAKCAVEEYWTTEGL